MVRWFVFCLLVVPLSRVISYPDDVHAPIPVHLRTGTRGYWVTLAHTENLIQKALGLMECRGRAAADERVFLVVRLISVVFRISTCTFLSVGDP